MSAFCRYPSSVDCDVNADGKKIAVSEMNLVTRFLSTRSHGASNSTGNRSSAIHGMVLFALLTLTTGCASYKQPTLGKDDERAEHVAVALVPTGGDFSVHGYTKPRPDAFDPGNLAVIDPVSIITNSAYNGLVGAYERSRRDQAQRLLNFIDLEIPTQKPERILVQKIIDSRQDGIAYDVFTTQPDFQSSQATAMVLASETDADLIILFGVIPSLSEDLTQFRLDAWQVTFVNCTSGDELCVKQRNSRQFSYIGTPNEIDRENAAPANPESFLKSLDEFEAARANTSSTIAVANNSETDSDRYRKDLADESFLRWAGAVRDLWTPEALAEEFDAAMNEISIAVNMDWDTTNVWKASRQVSHEMWWTDMNGIRRLSRVNIVKRNGDRALYLVEDGSTIISSSDASPEPL